MKPSIYLFRSFKLGETVDPILLKFKYYTIDNVDFRIALVVKGLFFIGLSEDKIVFCDMTAFKIESKVRVFSYDEVDSFYLDFIKYKMKLRDGSEVKVLTCSTADQELLDAFVSEFEEIKKGNPQRELYYYNVIDGNLVIDKTNKKIYLPNKKDLDWSSIVGIEVEINDGEVHKSGVGGVMSAAAGGLLAGGVGAIIGASLSSKKVKKIIYSIYVYIKTNDFNNPTYKICVLNKKMKSDSKDFSQVKDGMHKLCAALEIVINEK